MMGAPDGSADAASDGASEPGPTSSGSSAGAASQGQFTGTAARDELRSRRHRAILTTALQILTTDGHDALTMHRIAAELECGVASIYRLFPSKDALLAELQLDALRLLDASWGAGAALLEDTLAAEVTGDSAEEIKVLARTAAAPWFWIAAERSFSYEIDLTRRVVVDRSTVVPTEQAGQVLALTLAMFDRGRQALDAAVESGALDPGNSMERAIVVVSSIFGVALTSKFSRWDIELFDGQRVAGEALCDLFLAWGANPEHLQRVGEILRAEAEAGRLAPVLESQS